MTGGEEMEAQGDYRFKRTTKNNKTDDLKNEYRSRYFPGQSSSTPFIGRLLKLLFKTSLNKILMIAAFTFELQPGTA